MQILDLLNIYFDAGVVFVTNSSLLFRFYVAILCSFVSRKKTPESVLPLHTAYIFNFAVERSVSVDIL